VKKYLQKFSSLFCLSLIKSYRILFSPILPPSCRFTPTCSQYAIDAIERHGTWRGIYLAARRLLRCHPFNRGGYDPVDG
jgi:putative membrane protein insertion efficiency factor